MTTGKVPFIYPTEKMTYESIIANNKNYETWMSNELKNFIEMLLTTDVSKRMNLEESLKHPWLQTEEINTN